MSGSCVQCGAKLNGYNRTPFCLHHDRFRPYPPPQNGGVLVVDLWYHPQRLTEDPTPQRVRLEAHLTFPVKPEAGSLLVELVEAVEVPEGFAFRPNDLAVVRRAVAKAVEQTFNLRARWHRHALVGVQPRRD